MHIGLFGGTFNPPHLGHIRALQAAMAALPLDEVWVIPSGLPPHKKLPAGSPTALQRLEMTRLAVADLPNVRVLDLEVTAKEKSYSWQTIETLKREHPGDEFTFLMGTDMFLTLPQWVRWEHILESVAVAVFARADGQRAAIETFAEELRGKHDCRIAVVENDPLDISSTRVRAALETGENCSFLDEKVRAYIRKNGLYGQMVYDFAAYEAYAREHLSAKRMRHVLGCAEEAVRLARRWGADEEDARAAGLLHDITKELGLEDQLKLCNKYGMILDTVERTAPKLLHSKTGAAIAKYEFGVPDRVYWAIFWHTTGKADMGLLEKVLFMADYIEPTRDFEGVEELRTLAYNDLEASMIRGLELTAQEVKERGQQLHVKSVEALDWLLERKRS